MKGKFDGRKRSLKPQKGTLKVRVDALEHLVLKLVKALTTTGRRK